MSWGRPETTSQGRPLDVRLEHPQDVISRRPQNVRSGRPRVGTSWGPIFAGWVVANINYLEREPY